MNKSLNMRLLPGLLLVGLCGQSSIASAKNAKVVDYRYNTIWSTTIRFLRVDRQYPVTDKDRDNGYIMFVFPGSGAVKRCPASLEIIAFTDQHGYQRHRLQLSIAHQPGYVEVHLLDKIERKLHDEHGRPPPPKRVKPDEDKGKDKDKDKGDNKEKKSNGQ